MTTEPSRYTADEIFNLYFEFLKDPAIHQRLKRHSIRTWEHEELLLRFFAYLKNVPFIDVKADAEVRKWEERNPGKSLDNVLKRPRVQSRPARTDGAFGDSGDGTLFQPNNPQ